MTAQEKGAWVEESRIRAILGNSAATMKSLRSGVSCYITFVGAHVGLAMWRYCRDCAGRGRYMQAGE